MAEQAGRPGHYSHTVQVTLRRLMRLVDSLVLVSTRQSIKDTLRSQLPFVDQPLGLVDPLILQFGLHPGILDSGVGHMLQFGVVIMEYRLTITH